MEEPDGIILAAIDYYKMENISSRIVEAGIELVLIDSGVKGNSYDSLVATENYIAGYKVGEEMARWLDHPEHVVIINHVQGALTAMDRERGAIDGLKNIYSDVTTEIFYCNDDEEIAYRYLSQLINYGIKVDGVIALNEVASEGGAAMALDDFYGEYSIPMVGFDSSIDEIQYLEKGIIDALVVQQPFNMGYTAMTTMMELLNHKNVKKRIDTGSKVITKDNMYAPENQVILFPFQQ